jgi:hypothetical protein
MFVLFKRYHGVPSQSNMYFYGKGKYIGLVFQVLLNNQALYATKPSGVTLFCTMKWVYTSMKLTLEC